MSMAAAPMASNTTIKTAVTAAIAPRELVSGSVTEFMTVSFMAHHRLCVNDERIRNSRHRWDIGNEEVVPIGRMDGQGIGIRQTGPGCREGHAGGIDSRI